MAKASKAASSIEAKEPKECNRAEAIARIKKALKARSGKAWSVTGGRGTGWGWLTITAPPARRVNGIATDADNAELAKLLGLKKVACQGASVADSGDHYAEYIDRAEGRKPKKIAEDYWD